MRLDVAQAVELAEQFNPRLRAAGAAIEEGQAGILTARAYLNPDITVGSFGRQRATQETAVPGLIQGFTLTQRVELPSVRRTRLDVADLGRRMNGFALAETRLDIHASVKQAFYQVLRRREEREIARETLQLLEDLQRRIQIQVNVGEAARLELIRADTEVSTARIQVQSAELRRVSALAALSGAIGAPLDRELDPQDTLDPPVSLPDLETLRDRVLAGHPSIALAETDSRRGKARIASEIAQRKPQPTVWLDVFQQPDSAQYRYGVSLPLPLWNRREGPIAEAVAAQRGRDAIADLRKVEIGTALELAHSLYQVANQQVTMFEAGTLREAEAAVNAAQAAFRFGERGIIEVLDAQRVLRGARLDYLNAQYDRQAALIELERLGVVDLGGNRP